MGSKLSSYSRPVNRPDAEPPSASLGGSVTLTSQLNGTWQWYYYGVALDGQTAKTLDLTNITAADAGRYSVALSTATGTVTNHVYLLVDTQFERIDLGDTVPPGAAPGAITPTTISRDCWPKATAERPTGSGVPKSIPPFSLSFVFCGDSGAD